MNGLLNHLFQSTAFVLLIAVAAKALRRNSPRLRYWLWFTASAKFLIPFSLIVSTGARIHLPLETPLPRAETVAEISAYFEPVSETHFAPPAALLPPRPTRTGFPWRLTLTTVWLLGAFLLMVRWLRRWRAIHRAVSLATPLPIQSGVPVFSSPVLMEPGVFGLFRPVLMLPDRIVGKVTPKQLQAILAHELHHIRCFDNLTAAVHMGIETLFWFHPFVWWIGARLIDERERDCDEVVLRQGSQPADYARSILQVCDTSVKTALPCASGISGSDLKTRVQEIMTWRASLPVTTRGKTMLLSAAIGAVLVPFALGILKAQAATSIAASQLARPHEPATVVAHDPRAGTQEILGSAPTRTPQRLSAAAPVARPASKPMATLGATEFEVTSIRMVQGSLFGRLACQATDGIMETYVPSAALAKRLLRPTPVPQGRCVGQTDLGHLIELAYRLPALTIPEWAATQRFEIEAVAPNIANVTTSAFAEMLQHMLADRFKLAFHREMRDTRGYALLLARNGPRIKQASGPPEPPQLNITAGAQREATIKGKSSMTDLAEFLATLVSEGQVLSPVADETTLSGLYEYTITFSMPQAGPRGGATGDMLQAIAQALQEQLGLRIEARVTQTERIVVDHVERPSEN